MGALSNQIRLLLNWLKEGRIDKWRKIKAFEDCLLDELDELVNNTTRLAININGAMIYVWFPIDEATSNRIRYQVMLEFREELRISVNPFWVRNAVLPGAFDCVLSILNSSRYYDADKWFIKSFYKELCNKHHAIVKANMVKNGLLP